MLMCYDHHHLIDENPEIYTIERLHAMKDSQEKRVSEILDNLHATTTTIVSFTSPIKGKEKVSSLNMQQATEALEGEMLPEKAYPLCVSIPPIGEYKSQMYWTTAEHYLDNSCMTSIDAVLSCDPNAHISLFPQAPIPLIAKLGYRIGDSIRTDVYQKTREPDTWQWQSKSPMNSFDTTVTVNREGEGLALVISISGKVDLSKVISAANPKTIIEISAQVIGVDAIKSKDDLSCFWHKYQETCEYIKNTYHCPSISVFSAVPVSVAFEIGRRYMKGVYPLMDIYELEGEYFKTLTIGE